MVDRGRLNFCKDLSFVDPRIRSHAPSDKTLLLGAEYEPGYWDVICMGGKESYDHIGNRRFRVCIDNNLTTYTKAKTKHEKSMVVTVIVDAVRESSTQDHGGFVRKDLVSGRWYEVGDKIAREKVGHALRDAIKLKQKIQKRSMSSKPDQSNPDQPRPVKRRRTEISRNQNLEQSKPVPVPSGAVQSSQVADENEWRKSLSESAEQFAATEASDEGSQTGDSVLNDMALVTSGTSEVADEKAYQTSLAELQRVGDDAFSLDGCADTQVAADKQELPSAQLAAVEKPHDAFDNFMKNFLGTTPTGIAGANITTRIQWKPPGDSATEAAFETYMRRQNPKPFADSMKKPHPALNENNHLCAKISSPCANLLSGVPGKSPMATPSIVGDHLARLPSSNFNLPNKMGGGNGRPTKQAKEQQAPAVIDDLF